MALVGVVVGGTFLLYFLVYRVRHFSLPLGFDATWYMWRADFVATQGLGPLDTAVRPGTALLSALLGGLTGRSQLQLQVILPFVLVGTFAVAIGAAASEGLGREPGRWAVTAAVAAGLVGATRLVGENVANLLNVLLVVAGFVFVIRLAGRGRGFWGAVAMLVAAGVVHWLFLAVFGAVMALWFLLALIRARADRGAGIALLRTEAGALGSVGAAVAAGMAAVIGGLLRAPLSTFEIHEAKRRFLPKLREDLATIQPWFVGPVTAAGGWAMAAEGHRRARFAFLRMVTAWTAVTLIGLAVSAITLRLPPHRFLTLLVAGPVVLAAATGLYMAARWLARRAGRAGGVALALVGAVSLTVPGMLLWYGPQDLKGPEQFLDPTAFEQARTAAVYVEGLPPGRPVVFVVGPLGPFYTISVPFRERLIRAAMPADRQVDVHVYPGDPADLMAGRPTHPDDPLIDRANRPYWEDVRPILARDPAVLVLEGLGPDQFAGATGRFGAEVLAPGVALLEGPAPAGPVVPPSPVRPVPTTEVGVLWAAVLAVALILAGLGWTRWFLGAEAPPLTVVSLAPAVGAGALILGSLLAVKLGVRLGGTGGTATAGLVTVAGFAAAVGSAIRRRQRRQQ